MKSLLSLILVITSFNVFGRCLTNINNYEGLTTQIETTILGSSNNLHQVMAVVEGTRVDILLHFEGPLTTNIDVYKPTLQELLTNYKMGPEFSIAQNYSCKKIESAMSVFLIKEYFSKI